MKLRTAALLGVLLTALACVPGPTAKAPAIQESDQMSNLFPLQDGAVWKFQNPATGATLTIDWTRYAGSFCGSGGYPLYLSTWTKSDPANYWEPGTATTLYQLYYDDGVWVHSNAWWSDSSGKWYMQDMVPNGTQAAYPIMLDNFYAPGSIDAPYTERAAYQQPQSECLPESDNVQPVAWTTKFYKGVVDTPAYSGPVIESEQIEGCTPAVTFCNHEIWSFAPNLGLVQIQDLSGYGVNGLPIINMRVPDAPKASGSRNLHPSRTSRRVGRCLPGRSRSLLTILLLQSELLHFTADFLAPLLFADAVSLPLVRLFHGGQFLQQNHHALRFFAHCRSFDEPQ